MGRGVILKVYNSIYKSFMAVLFIAFMFTIILLNIITTDKEFSETENRVLSKMPRFSIKRVFEGKFTADYEEYLSDQIVNRDLWIGVKAYSEKLLGKRDNNEVYLGRDGYLLQMFKKPDMERLDNNAAAVNSFVSSNADVKTYFMLVPNSAAILEDKLPPFASPEDQLPYIDKVKNILAGSVKFVDVYNTLSSKKDEYIFYKTDHHWTTKGAYYAYKKLAFDMGITPNEQDYYSIKRITDSFYGSSYSKSGFRNIGPDTIELYMAKYDEGCSIFFYDKNESYNSLYKMDNVLKKDKYTVFLDGNHSLIKISTNYKKNKKLIIIKDS